MLWWLNIWSFKSYKKFLFLYFNKCLMKFDFTSYLFKLLSSHFCIIFIHISVITSNALFYIYNVVKQSQYGYDRVYIYIYIYGMDWSQYCVITSGTFTIWTMYDVIYNGPQYLLQTYHVSLPEPTLYLVSYLNILCNMYPSQTYHVSSPDPNLYPVSNI